MKKIMAFLMTVLFAVPGVFGAKIEKKEAESKLKAAEFLFLKVEKTGREAAPAEILGAEKALNAARKEFKEEEWRYAYQEADKVAAYVTLIEAILAFKKAEKDLEDFRRSQ